MSLSERWSRTLAELRERGRFRALKCPAGHDFTSNDYLGYGTHPLSADAPPTHGLSGLASRLLRGHHPIWDEVESQLAAWHGADAVLMMTSGYAANEGLIATLIEPGDWVASDERNHASIIDGLRLARPRKFLFRHNDLNHLESGLAAEHAKRPPERALFIVTESLFSMDGDTAPLTELAALAERYSAHLIVDEAHATGCFGASGSGLVDACGVRSRVLATVHTGGKALGLPGAYICGSPLLKDYFVNRCRHLIYTTALPPIVGAWWRDRIPQVRDDERTRRRLHANARRVRESLAAHGIAAAGEHYIVPVIVGSDAASVRAATAIQDAGFDVRAIRPPSVPEGTARLRVSIHADHEERILGQLAEAIAGALRT